MCSSSARTPKSQSAAEQPSTGECGIPPRKDILRLRAKKKLQQDSRRGAIAFKIKPLTHQRRLEGANKSSWHQDPGKGAMAACRDCARPACGCRLRGSGSSRPGGPGMGPKSSWRRSPLAPPYCCWAGDPQTGEQFYQRSSCTSAKVLGPATDFPTWDLAKGLRKGLEKVSFHSKTKEGQCQRVLKLLHGCTHFTR